MHPRLAYFVVYTLAVSLLIFPIWTVSVLPWQDYGDHIARVYILAHYSDAPSFQQHYEVKYVPLPNLAMDLIAPPLLRWFDPYITGKLVASLLILLFATGVHVLSKAVNPSINWLTIPAVFLVYNSLTLGGFVNYMFSVAVMLFAAAAWLRFDAKPSIWRGLLSTVLGFATYLSHISGFVCLFLLVSICVSYRVSRSRRVHASLLYRFIPLLPGVAAYASLGPGEQTSPTIRWESVADKIRYLWVPFNSYSTWVDGLVLLSLIAAAFLAWRYATVEWEPRLGIVALTFLLAFAVFPFEVGNGNEADVRFLIPALLIGIAAMKVRTPTYLACAGYAGLLVVFSIRILDMQAHWKHADEISREQHALIDQVAPNSLVYPLVFLPQDRSERKIRWQLLHMTGYATVDRRAISGSMLTFAGQQPIRRRIAFPFARQGSPLVPDCFAFGDVLAAYDYIWVYNPPPAWTSFLQQQPETLVGSAGAGSLYRILHGPGPKMPCRA